MGNLFCFYLLIFIVTFHEQLRDPNDNEHVLSVELTRHFYSRELSGEKMVSFTAEINEAKKALGNLGVGVHWG